MKPGSRLCVQCGFNLEQGTAVKTRVIRESRSKSKAPAVSSGPSMSPEFIGTIVIAVIGFLAVAIPLGMAQSGDDGSMFTIAWIALRLISLGVVIGAIAVVWGDSRLSALFAFLFFPWAMYCCVFKSTSPILRGLAGSMVLSWAFFVVVATQRASANPAQGGGGNGQEVFVEEGDTEGDEDPSQGSTQPAEYTPPL